MGAQDLIMWSNAAVIRDNDDAAATDKPAIKEHARDNDDAASTDKPAINEPIRYNMPAAAAGATGCKVILYIM